MCNCTLMCSAHTHTHTHTHTHCANWSSGYLKGRKDLSPWGRTEAAAVLWFIQLNIIPDRRSGTCPTALRDVFNWLSLFKHMFSLLSWIRSCLSCCFQKLVMFSKKSLLSLFAVRVQRPSPLCSKLFQETVLTSSSSLTARGWHGGMNTVNSVTDSFRTELHNSSNIITITTFTCGRLQLVNEG